MRYMLMTRRYPRGGTYHPEGAVVPMEDRVAEAAADGGFGRPATAEEIEAAGFDPPEEDPPRPDVDATEGAWDAADAHGFDLTPYAGKGSGQGGRITKPDVEAWLTSPAEA